MGLEHPTRTDAKVEDTDRPKPSDKPPGPPPDNPGAPGYPSRRESLARAREPAPQESDTQQPAIKDSGTRGTEARDKLAPTDEEKDKPTGPETFDREDDAAEQDVEADSSKPAEQPEQLEQPEHDEQAEPPEQAERDERDEGRGDDEHTEGGEGAESEQPDTGLGSDDSQGERDGKPTDAQTERVGEKAETHDDPAASKRPHTLPADNPGSPDQPSRRESLARAREPVQPESGPPKTETTDTSAPPPVEPAIEPASPPPEDGATDTDPPQEQEPTPLQDQRPSTDAPLPISESEPENARALEEGDAREPATQPEKMVGNDISAEPNNMSRDLVAPESLGDVAEDLDRGATGDNERLEGLDEGALERGISDRLKRFAAKLDRSDEPKEMEATVDRPNFQDPKAEPEAVPDRYGAPLDQVDGTRTPLFKGEPRREQTKQGLLGDCGIIATLGAVAAYYPEAIRSCVRETDDGNYQVRFHEARYSTSRQRFESTGQLITLTVTPELPIKDERPDQPAFARFTREKAAWVPVLEKAIAGTDQIWSAKRRERVNEIWQLRGNSGDAPTGYVRLNQGSGFGERAELLTQLTGLPAKSVPFPEGYDNQGRSADRRLQDDILKQLSQGKPVLVGTRDLDENESRLPRKLIDGHVYEVTEIDDKGRLHLRNPWNNRHPEPMAIQEFKRGVRPFYSTVE